jgi:hypothetical protein
MIVPFETPPLTFILWYGESWYIIFDVPNNGPCEVGELRWQEVGECSGEKSVSTVENSVKYGGELGSQPVWWEFVRWRTRIMVGCVRQLKLELAQ